jgi:tRNA threonylcarbamoyladenosine biosynthesis protein TsaE
MNKIITISTFQTKKIAEKFIQKISKDFFQKKTLVLGLIGNLGSGKTTFIQGLARGLGIKEKITSPTFIIIKRYNLSIDRQISKFKTFYHLDCYRIEKTKELLNLDFKKIIKDPQNIIVIEWADKFKKIIPQETIWIKLRFINNKTREIIIKDDKK